MLTSPRNFSHLSVTLILYGILIFSPLARGGAHLWVQTLLLMTIMLAGAVMLLERWYRAEPVTVSTPLDKPITALGLWCIVSLTLSEYRPVSMGAVVTLLAYIAFFYILLHSIRTRKDQRQLVSVIIGVALFLSLFGYFQRFGMNPFWWWRYEGLNVNSHFLSSTYGNHNHLAGYLEMSLPLLLGLFLTRTRRGMVLLLMIYGVGVIAIAHALALSRGGWLALALSLCFMGIALLAQQRFRSKKMLLTLAACILFLALFILTGTHMVERMMTMTQEETIVGLNGRSIAWSGTVAMIKDHLLVGSGPGTYATIFTQYQPPGFTARFFYAHNDYLHYIAELGLPIVLIMGWLLFVLFKTGFSKLNNPSRQTWGITLGAMTGIVAMLIHSIGDFNLHLPANALLFITLAALVMSQPTQKQ